MLQWLWAGERMLLGIPDKDKLRLSAFISFYLKKWLKDHPNESKESLIVGICSQAEFEKILQGRILKDSTTYEYLLLRLGFSYNDQDKLIPLSCELERTFIRFRI